MSKHQSRHARAYAAGARNALETLRSEMHWTRPPPAISSSIDILINRVRDKFSMPEPSTKIAKETREQKEAGE